MSHLPASLRKARKVRRKGYKPTYCLCGNVATAGYLSCGQCRAIEHDWNVEMFGADAEYMEVTGLDSEIGNH